MELRWSDLIFKLLYPTSSFSEVNLWCDFTSLARLRELAFEVCLWRNEFDLPCFSQNSTFNKVLTLTSTVVRNGQVSESAPARPLLQPASVLVRPTISAADSHLALVLFLVLTLRGTDALRSSFPQDAHLVRAAFYTITIICKMIFGYKGFRCSMFLLKISLSSTITTVENHVTMRGCMILIRSSATCIYDEINIMRIGNALACNYYG